MTSAALGAKIEASCNRFIASKSVSFTVTLGGSEAIKQLESVADSNYWVTVLADWTGRAALTLAGCFVGIGQQYPKDAKG